MGKSAVVKLYTQSEIRSLVYPNAPNKNNLDWFNGSNANANDIAYYPAAVFLRGYTTYSNWTFMSHYFNSVTPSSVYYVVEHNIDLNRPVLVDGTSIGSDRIHPDYPNSNISHWVVAYGYTDSGDMLICDPAYNGTGLSFTLSTGYYSVTSAKLAAYANRTGGLIY